MSNLKQIALGFALWSQDHQNHFPMELPASEGGTREASMAGNAVPSFVIISNGMRTSTLLICPVDKKRKPAKDFANVATANISYFLNADAAFTNRNQNQIIAGDRNLSLARVSVKPGLLEITNPDALDWTSGHHPHGGNVALVDGSAHQVTTKNLRDILIWSGPTNRLIIP
jgi:hypothetical protein